MTHQLPSRELSCLYCRGSNAPSTGCRAEAAEPGLIAHWTFPKGLSEQSIWLGHYVILSRPVGFSYLLSHGLPDRKIIEGGPPEDITVAFDEFFSQKIADTKVACASAREIMQWPPRPE